MSSNQGASKGKFKTGDKNSPEDQVRLENQFLSSSFFSGCVVFIPASHFVPSFPETGGENKYLQFGVLYG